MALGGPDPPRIRRPPARHNGYTPRRHQGSFPPSTPHGHVVVHARDQRGGAYLGIRYRTGEHHGGARRRSRICRSGNHVAGPVVLPVRPSTSEYAPRPLRMADLPPGPERPHVGRRAGQVRRPDGRGLLRRRRADHHGERHPATVAHPRFHRHHRVGLDHGAVLPSRVVRHARYEVSSLRSPIRSRSHSWARTSSPSTPACAGIHGTTYGPRHTARSPYE